MKKIFFKNSIKNGVWLYALQMFNLILPLMTLPYVTRVLETSKYGVFSIALNIFGYAQVIIEYGFNMSATREVVLAKKNDKLVANLFTEVVLTRVFLLLASFLVIITIFFIAKTNVEQVACIVLMMGGGIGIAFDQTWLFQGMQEMKYISIVSMIARVITVSFIFIFVKGEKDLYLYCFLYGLTNLINGILGIIVAKIKFHVLFTKITFQSIYKSLKKGRYIFSTQISSKIFGSIGITFLGIYASSEMVGIYAAINKIPNLILLLWAPVAQVLYPIISLKMEHNYIDGKKYVFKMRNIILPIFILIAVLLACFSRQTVGIAFGKEYEFFFIGLFHY